MNRFSSKYCASRWLVLLSACVGSAACVSGTNPAAAEEKPAPPPLKGRFVEAAPPRQGAPKGDVLIEAPRIEYTQAIPGGEANVLYGKLVDAEAAPATPEALQKQLKDLQQQQEQILKQYEEALRAKVPSQLRDAIVAFGDQTLEQRRESAQARHAELLSKRNQLVQEGLILAPLPENATLKAFTLRYVKPDEIGKALHNITGTGGPRIAVDERTNALLIAGTDRQISVADQLVQTLDQPAETDKHKSTETLQVRVVWIVDGLPGTEGKSVEPPYVSPQVLDGLTELGFETPRVMCQQVSMLTLDRDKRNGGQFHFQLPVLVQGSPWQFEGQGFISATEADRYALQFNLNLGQPRKDDCQLSGSIVTPLSHYNVLGTTTFVNNEQDAGLVQHLSAFVIYLDHPREFEEKKK